MLSGRQPCRNINEIHLLIQTVNRRAAGSSPARGANSFISADLVLAARRLPFWGPFGRPPKEPVGRPGTRRNKLARHCSAHRCFHVFHDGGLREISLSCCGYMRASACLGNSKSRQKTGRSSCRSEKSKILLTPSPRVNTIFGNSFQPIEDSRRVTGQGLTLGIGLRMIPDGADTYSFACQLLRPRRSRCHGDTAYFRNSR